MGVLRHAAVRYAVFAVTWLLVGLLFAFHWVALYFQSSSEPQSADTDAQRLAPAEGAGRGEGEEHRARPGDGAESASAGKGYACTTARAGRLGGRSCSQQLQRAASPRPTSASLRGQLHTIAAPTRPPCQRGHAVTAPGTAAVSVGVGSSGW